MTEMKFYIFKEIADPETGDLNEYPMRWDEQAVQFDTEANAQRFLEVCRENSDPESEFYKGAFIKECIFSYDGGYINCENLTIIIDAIRGEQLIDESD